VVQKIVTSISFIPATHDAHEPWHIFFRMCDKGRQASETRLRMKRGHVGAVPVLVYGYRTWHLSVAAIVGCPALSTQPTVDGT
jgi:hypothetical protein